MTLLNKLLDTYREAAQAQREKGTYFEDLIICYLRNEASYKDLYSDVWTYADWAKEQGMDARDTGIDLVAKTAGTDEYHAIQCKFYAPDYRVKKNDIDSFFTASGKKPFTHRVIIVTTNHWGEHAENALQNQQPPVSKIDLNDLENSQIDWARYQPDQAPVLKPKKTVRPHQETAIGKVTEKLATADRGKLIMACGTGKTYTSLKIAEQLAGSGKRVLFLVPSLSLLSQTLTEWTQEANVPLHSFAVCSDSDVGKKRKKDDDIVQTFTHELRYPATTDAGHLAKEMSKRHDSHHMSVVFSTYHSIAVISKAQKEYDLAGFDLIICDEAHRTTGATFDGEDESNFVKVHDADFIQATKRLYMTATPRIYGDVAKATAEKDNVALCSMDDESLFGEELHVISFSEAVRQKLLVDYKVIVLAIDEEHINQRLQKLLADDENQLKVDDAAKIVGCWKALSKQGASEDLIDDNAAMRRAVAFCQVIEPSNNAKTHKVSSKNIARMFKTVVDAYREEELKQGHSDQPALALQCEAAHIDGSMNASEKEAQINWLKAETPESTCRILSNVRCLSEGVDVPALDAVLFLTPRNSQVDVVQSVGRVMRLAEGKKRGYIILPVVIPAGVEPHKALDDNQTYKVVWQVLQALRAHDDRFDAMINKLDLIGKDTSKMEVIAITDKVTKKAKKSSGGNTGKGTHSLGKKTKKPANDQQQEIPFEVDDIQRAIYAKVVKKCGNRNHWEDWANDIAKIARTHINRIQTLLDNPENTEEIAAFNAFAKELRDDLNDAISDAEIVEMLAQHLITKPVFDALFKDYSFAKHNPMSIAMQDILDKLEAHRLDKEADTLHQFYDSVKMRAEGIDSAEGKQKIVVELYDKFFRNAFPRMTERLGIVYTPVEVVDFIIHSVNDVLKNEFGQTLGGENVHIIDPFTGTGTFITRLLQSGLIDKAQLPYKYKNEIHANEIVLLAYYIAAINIEAVYHDLVGGDYQPFNGICLTDTFQLYEKGDLVSDILVDNSARRNRQKKLDIRVIIGNPPYSAGQDSANDNNQNVVYPHLDGRIRSSYAERSTATLKNALYNSYIRAIRWASDRIGNSGVIGFITNVGFLEANNADGLRRCLNEEFSSIYVFHLRGGIRGKFGELAKKEGQNVFDIMTGVSISILVKNPNANHQGHIYFYDIGDYLNREEKKRTIRDLVSIEGITKIQGWRRITPDQHGDWLKQRDVGFSKYAAMGDKNNKDILTLFNDYSRGVQTGRDAWCYNASKTNVISNMKRMIGVYNSEVTRFSKAFPSLDKKTRESKLDEFINADTTQISWTRGLKQELIKERTFTFEADCLIHSMYRPFAKQWLYFNRRFNEMVLKMPRILPDTITENRVIMIKARWSGEGQIALITDRIASDQPDGGAQCFPLKLYEPAQTDDSQKPSGLKPQTDLFSTEQVGLTANVLEQAVEQLSYTVKDGITDAGLDHFQTAYPNETISKEDLFYYIYGLLHSEDYKARYADNLSKELPRIPCVKTAAGFWAFSKAGRELATLHIDYEKQLLYPVKLDCGSKAFASLTPADFYVTKMKFASKADKTTVIYNHAITIKGIPLEAYEYVVNGKPALEWVMERQAVSTHKDSGIVNDANAWAIETMKNARYPLELFQRVITVSLETMKIVKALPPLVIGN